MITKHELDPEQQWEVLTTRLQKTMNLKTVPDLNAVLFLIGVQELGKGQQSFSKEEKQDLMHIAICKVLSYSGYYQLQGLDEQGWPHWKLVKKLPFLDILSQETYLKAHIVEYFEKEIKL